MWNKAIISTQPFAIASVSERDSAATQLEMISGSDVPARIYLSAVTQLNTHPHVVAQTIRTSTMS